LNELPTNTLFKGATMSNTNTGGPAFPTPRYERGDMYSLGMTLRDYFAAKAMQAIISCRGEKQLMNADIADNIAFMSYCVSDAMLKAREA
jgi:hypothetical protein